MVGMTMDIFARELPNQRNRPWSLVSLTVAAMLIATLFLTRFALTLGERELSLPLVVVLLGTAVLLVTGAVAISPTRALLFGTAMAAMLAASVFGGAVRVSWASYLNVVLLYACYMTVAPDDFEFARAIRLFRLFMVVIAIAGIVQFFAQVAIRGPTLFTFNGIFPAQIISHGFNYVIPVPGLGGLNKSNGFFLVEPSSFSQLTALAIIIELEFFRPSWRLGLFGAGLVLSFSGTGLLLFVAIVPLYMIRRGWGGLLLLGVPTALAGAALLAGPKLAALLGRVGEIGSDQSSAFARFLSPFYLFDQYLFPNLDTTLFGMGPGSIEPFFKKAAYQIHDPTWGKLVFEYGLVGAAPFLIFVMHCFFAGTRSIWLSAALFLNYLILGGNLVDARVQTLILVLVVLQNRPADIRHAQAAAARANRTPSWPGESAPDNDARTETRTPAPPHWQ
jgi:hypothetical protein